MKNIDVKTFLGLLLENDLVLDMGKGTGALVELEQVELKVSNITNTVSQTMILSPESLDEKLEDWEVYFKKDVFYIGKCVILKGYTLEEIRYCTPGTDIYLVNLYRKEPTTLTLTSEHFRLVDKLTDSYCFDTDSSIAAIFAFLMEKL